ncbi:13292_t:CDS:2 [Funneliformis geosporum]|uniref:13292_t:CDS:1 n=1 Tax=Funneliformis geosporum TaxID=1117311 RepID=A0A9W4SW27_9GLOM|nr:13292_t:CDS:2 [Funneliformis geosporum]
MSMYLYDNRLKSYTSKKRKWPYKASDGYKATPEILAKAGFYFKPSQTSPDNVICFLCHKSMERWDPTDDPLEEHVNHSPNCAWAICRCIKRKFTDDELPFSWDNKEQLPTSKKMEEVRLKTFGNWWPHDGKKGWIGTSKKMAKAGFYHAPTYESIDHVACMYCEVGLEGWLSKDDPIEEHRKRLPSCPIFATPVSKLKKVKVAALPCNNNSSRRNTENAIKIVNEDELDELTDQIKEVKQVDGIRTNEKENVELLDNAKIIEEDKLEKLDILQNDLKPEEEVVKDNSKEPSYVAEIIDLTSDSVNDEELRTILPIECEVINLDESEFDRKSEEILPTECEVINLEESEFDQNEEILPIECEILSIEDYNINEEHDTSNGIIIEDLVSIEVEKSVNLNKIKSLECLIKGSMNIGGKEKSIRESKLTDLPVKRLIGSFYELNENDTSSDVQEDRQNDLSNSNDNVTSLEIQRLSAELNKGEELDELTDQIKEVEQVNDIRTNEKENGERLDNANIIEEEKEESLDILQNENLIKRNSLECEEKSIRESKLTDLPVKRLIDSFNEHNENGISFDVQEDYRGNDLSNSDDNVTSLEIQRLSAELKIHELKILESISDNADDFDIINTNVRMSDIDLNKENNEKIISPQKSDMCSNLTAPEGLKESRIIQLMPHTPLAKHTPESTVPTRTNCNKIKPSAFVTPKEQNGKAAFTVEDYLRSLTETQHLRLVEKTNQKIETLIELKKRAKEAILSIPII